MKFANISCLVVEFVVSCDLHELSELTRYRLANHFGINQNYLSKRFKEDTGMTVLEFINRERLKRAESMLKRCPELSVRKISTQVGIAKVEQFRTKFKKIYGLKPGKYRSLAIR